MFQCHVCGSREAKKAYIREFFEIEGHLVMVENIPALVCVRCGEEILSRETTEHIRQLVHSAPQPIRSVALDVLTYA